MNVKTATYKQVLLPVGTVILFVPSYVACLWIEELENAGLVNQYPGMSSFEAIK